MREFDTFNVSSDASIGTEVGIEYKTAIQERITHHQELYPNSSDVAMEISRYLDPTMAHMIDIVDHIMDMAKAAGVDFARLFDTFIPERTDQTQLPYHKPALERCTDLVSFNPFGFIIGFNEDWMPGEPGAYLKILKTPSVMGLWYPDEGLGSSISVNKHGVWQCTNQVDVAVLDKGVPRLLMAWKLTQMPSLEKALHMIQEAPQASAFTYVFVQDRKAIRVENAQGQTQWREACDTMASANDLLYAPLTQHQTRKSFQSQIRYQYAQEKGHANMTQDEMITFLSRYPVSRPETLASVVATNRNGHQSMNICYGRPVFESVYVSYAVEFADEQL